MSLDSGLDPRNCLNMGNPAARLTRLTYALLCGLGACMGGQSTDDGQPRQRDETGVPPVQTPGLPGREPQPPPGGSAECQVDADCAQPALALLSDLASPAAGPGPLTTSRCYELTTVGWDGFPASGPACECEVEGWGTASLGPAGLDVAGSGCFQRGRGGECLFDDADFEGCTPGEPDSCRETCERFHARIEDNAARVFDGEVVDASCNGACQTVVRIGERCFPKGSERYTGGYDCALGVEGVLAAHAQVNRDPADTLELFESGRYPQGTDGVIELTVERLNQLEGDGTAWFSANAQFYERYEMTDGRYGETVDPLEGPDDCSIRRSSALSTGGWPAFLRVDDLVLLDEGQAIPLAEGTSATPRDGYYRYHVQLTPEGIAPRYGGRYGLRGGGGSFGARFELDNLRLPQDLQPSVQDTLRVDPEAFTLTWQGGGSGRELVRVYISLRERFQRGSGGDAVEVYCELTDDGQHTFDPDIFRGLQANFAVVYVSREQRHQHRVGDRVLATLTRVSSGHDVAWGPGCDSAEILAACHAATDDIAETFAACGVDNPPTREERCPALLAEACGTCAEHFACAARDFVCDGRGLVRSSQQCPCP